MRNFLAIVAIAAMCGVAASQRTIVVDRLNRPGTDYVNMQPAVNAAMDGDTVLVRYVDFPATGQYYDAPTIVAKTLVLRGEEPPPPVVGQFAVRGLSAAQRVTIAGFRNGDDRYDNNGLRAIPYRGVSVTDCRGLVVVDRMVIGVPNTNSVSVYRVNGSAQPPPILVQSSDMVMISNSIVHQCYASSAVDCGPGRLFATNCYFGGGTIERGWSWSGTVFAHHGGDVTLTNCTVVGTDGWSYPPLGLFNYASPAVVMWDGVVRCGGYTSLAGGWTLYFQDAAVKPLNSAFTIGPVFVDPRTVVAGGFSVYTRPVHGAVAAAGWTLDESAQTLTLRHYTEPGSLAVFAMGDLLSSPAPLPQGLLYLDPSRLFVLAASPPTSTGDHTLTLNVAPLPPFGTGVAVQCAELTANGTFRLTQPILPGRY